jgi:hypothetical protein
LITLLLIVQYQGDHCPNLAQEFSQKSDPIFVKVLQASGNCLINIRINTLINDGIRRQSACPASRFQNDFFVGCRIETASERNARRQCDEITEKCRPACYDERKSTQKQR